MAAYMGMELTNIVIRIYMTGHMNMDGVINAMNEYHRNNKKRCRNATYFKPRSEISKIIHCKGSQIIPCSLELSRSTDF